MKELPPSVEPKCRRRVIAIRNIPERRGRLPLFGTIAQPACQLSQLAPPSLIQLYQIANKSPFGQGAMAGTWLCTENRWPYESEGMCTKRRGPRK